LEEEREETILRIEDAMLPAPSVILNAEDYVADAARRVQDTPQDIFLIRMHPKGWNIITRDTVRILSS
jgi:hypothetical protein